MIIEAVTNDNVFQISPSKSLPMHVSLFSLLSIVMAEFKMDPLIVVRNKA